MMRKRLLFTALLIPLLIINILVAQEDKPAGNKLEELIKNIPQDTSKRDLKIRMIEDFENCDAWKAAMPPNQGLARAKKVLGAPDPVKKSGAANSQYCLGVKEWGYKRGFNWTEIKPPTPIVATGRIKALAIWAIGRNYRHRLEIWIRNYQGIEYPVDMGSLNYRGWKQLAERIPMFIPYYTKYVPQYKPMYITKIVIRHDPNEIHGNFYIYLDNLEAIVDEYDDSFDGDDMINELGQERWEEVTLPPEAVKQKPGTAPE